MGKYDDIINLPHHVSDYHKPMPMEARAAQFAPFAALNGHDDAIAETARLTEAFRELTDDEKTMLSHKLQYALKNNSLIAVTYFIPDKSKTGGSYNRIIGKVRKWDEYDHTIHMPDGTVIPIAFISEITLSHP